MEKKNKTHLNNISLKIIKSDDLDHIHTWTSDLDVMKTMRLNHCSSKSETKNFLQNIAEPHPWFKCICLNDIPIGFICLEQGKNEFTHKVTLSYALSKQYWNKGITTKALIIALDEGFKIPQVCRIEAFVDLNNIASQKVLLKVGMTQEGILKKYINFKGNICDRLIYSKTI